MKGCSEEVCEEQDCERWESIGLQDAELEGIGGNQRKLKRNQRELNNTGESWRGSEAREGDQRDMQGLERRGVD